MVCVWLMDYGGRVEQQSLHKGKCYVVCGEDMFVDRKSNLILHLLFWTSVEEILV